MSIQHLKSTTDRMWPQLHIGAVDVASQNYYLRNSLGQDTLLLSGDRSFYQVGGNDLTIVVTNGTFSTGNFRFLVVGSVCMFDWRLDVVANGGADLSFNCTLPAGLFSPSYDFSASTDANGLASGFAAGSSLFGMVTASGTGNIVFALPSAIAATYQIHVHGSFTVSA